MSPSASDVVDRAVEELAQLVGGGSLAAAADAFDAYAGTAPTALHERIAAAIGAECRDAAECVGVRRAFLQGFRL